MTEKDPVASETLLSILTPGASPQLLYYLPQESRKKRARSQPVTGRTQPPAGDNRVSQVNIHRGTG